MTINDYGWPISVKDLWLQDDTIRPTQPIRWGIRCTSPEAAGWCIEWCIDHWAEVSYASINEAYHQLAIKWAPNTQYIYVVEERP